MRRLEQDHAAHRGAAIQRALRPAQHLYAVEPEKIGAGEEIQIGGGAVVHAHAVHNEERLVGVGAA